LPEGYFRLDGNEIKTVSTLRPRGQAGNLELTPTMIEAGRSWIVG